MVSERVLSDVPLTGRCFDKLSGRRHGDRNREAVTEPAEVTVRFRNILLSTKIQ